MHQVRGAGRDKSVKSGEPYETAFALRMPLEPMPSGTELFHFPRRPVEANSQYAGNCALGR